MNGWNNDRSGTAGRALPLLALVLLANGCLYVGVDIEELRTHIDPPTLSVPAHNSAPIGSALTAANAFDFDLRQEVARGLLELVEHANITTLRLRPNGGVEDLAFVRSVEIRMSAPDSDLPPVTAARYLRPDGTPTADGAVDMAIEEGIEHRDYITRPVQFDVEVTFEYPGKAWSFGVDLGLELALGYKGQLL